LCAQHAALAFAANPPHLIARQQLCRAGPARFKKVLHCNPKKGKANYLFSDNEGADMRTTILAYVIAVLGLVMICGGIYSFFDLWNARAPLRHYAITIGLICGGFAMGGIAQALRQLLVLVYAIPPH
jgi:hypothetical protein